MRRYRLLIILLLVDGFLAIAHIFLRQELGFFNLDKEQSLKAAYAGMKLLLAGGVAVLYTLLLSRERARLSSRVLWALVAALFLYLGVDEMIAFHERVGFVLNRWTGLSGYRGESFNWLIYFSPFIALALLVYYALIRVVWREERQSGVGLLMGTLFFAVALVVEAIGGSMLATPIYPFFIALEETAQLVGTSVFLATFLHLFQKKFYHLFSLRI